MRVLVAILALFPIFAAAQSQDPNIYQITSGTILDADGAVVSGNGFTGNIYGGPEFLSAGPVQTFYGGVPQLGYGFGDGLVGTDDGVGLLDISNQPNDPALTGLVQVFGLEGFEESGQLTVSPTIDVTGAGIYSAPFTMSVELAYGPPAPDYTEIPTEYVNFVGHGTVTLNVGSPECYENGECNGPLPVNSLTYTFAPELNPASFASALTLLCGGLLVLRARRSRVR